MSTTRTITEISPEVRAAVEGDRLLSWLLDEQIKREAVRYDSWARASGVNAGVCWSGMYETRDFIPKSDIQLLAAAREEYAGRMAVVARDALRASEAALILGREASRSRAA